MAIRPWRALSLPISAALAALWILLRAVIFGDFLFPLTYVLPLLVCVWSRDRLALWGMALLFAAVHTMTQPWFGDARLPSGDVALLDIGLPGIDGYEVARRLRSHPATGRTFLVAVTGWGEDADQELAREAGFNAHVTKPPDPDEIIRLVDSAPAERWAEPWN